MPNRSQAVSVTFSLFAELAILPIRDTDDCKWYSQNEHQYFRRELVREIHATSRLMNNASEEDISRETLLQCIGIEAFLTDGLAQHIQQNRREHIEAVLREQSRQIEQGHCIIEILSSVSESKSQWSKERAAKLALDCSELLD